MAAEDDGTAARLARGALAGLVAGVAASLVMDRFQAVVSALSASQEEGEPATQQAADAVAAHTAGGAVPEADKPLAGQAIHYALGAALGVAYGIAAEFRPAVAAGQGTAFGLGTATLLDQAAVPALGLGDPPWQAEIGTTAYSYVSHLVFGATAELVRRQVRGTLVG